MYNLNIIEIERFPMNKVDYMTLIDVEKSIMKMDRLFDKV